MKLMLVAIALTGALTCQQVADPGATQRDNGRQVSDPGALSGITQSQVGDPASSGTGNTIGDPGGPGNQRVDCPTTEQGLRELERTDPVTGALCRARRDRQR